MWRVANENGKRYKNCDNSDVDVHKKFVTDNSDAVRKDHEIDDEIVLLIRIMKMILVIKSTVYDLVCYDDYNSNNYVSDDDYDDDDDGSWKYDPDAARSCPHQAILVKILDSDNSFIFAQVAGHMFHHGFHEEDSWCGA